MEPTSAPLVELTGVAKSYREGERERVVVRYWEGAVSVRGISADSPGGSGYAEMTGYGAKDRKGIE